MHLRPLFPLCVIALLLLLITPAAAVNVTATNTTTVLPADVAYLPFEIWLPLAIAPFLFLFLSLWPGINAHDLWALLAFIFSAAAAYLSTAIAFVTTHTEVIDGEIFVIPVEIVTHPPYLPYLISIITAISVINLIRVVWEDYFRPIRDEKLMETGDMPPMR
jgi:hypothetical protein